MNTSARYRGQPLVALLLLIGGWITLRVIAWEGGALPLVAPQVAVAAEGDAAPAAIVTATSASVPPTVASPPVAWPVGAPVLSHPAPTRPALPDYRPRPVAPPLLPPAPAMAPTPGPLAAPSAAPVPASISAAHQTLWMPALANLPLPPSLVALPVAPLARPEARRDRRWSADGWLLLRSGGSAFPAGGLAPSTYGASQAGAVLRYRLAPASAHRPALYLRGSAALNGSREREVAFGASARPVAGVPVALAAEARVNAQPGGTRVRPAAFAYTELAPVALRRGLRAEFYGQAGYVGGGFASPFADGQLRVDGRLAQLGRGELRAGGGAWGGAQKGASRLDVGPTATLGLPLGGSAAARLGLDWRFRVAGSAAPESGPALTLSAGF